MLIGLLSETPLGRVISIRSEDDKDTLKSFTPDMHRIRNEWRNRISKTKEIDPRRLEIDMKMLERTLERLFCK